jgi:hypothetical protein
MNHAAAAASSRSKGRDPNEAPIRSDNAAAARPRGLSGKEPPCGQGRLLGRKLLIFSDYPIFFWLDAEAAVSLPTVD